MNLKFILIFLFTSVIVSNSFSANYYWKGGAGDWSDLSHWAVGSVIGPTATVLPTFSDNVIFGSTLTSGLGAGAIVNMDVPVDVLNFDYQNASGAFIFDGLLTSIQINGNFLCKGTVLFNWGVDFIMNPSTLSTIKSDGTAWTHNFTFVGTNTSRLTDDLITTGDIIHDSGTLDLNSNELSCNNLISTSTNTRTLKLNTSTLTLTGNLFDANNTGLTVTSTGADVYLSSAVAYVFNGAGHNYNNIHIQSSSIDLNGNNFFNFFELISNPIVTLQNGSIQSISNFDSNGTCASPTVLQSIFPGASGSIQYTGATAFSGSNLSIINVDALSPPVNSYNIVSSDTTNGSDGWNYSGTKFYWIGGTGNWSDPNHWSLSSNGPSSGCIPTIIDSVEFDALSGLSLATDVVTLDIPVQVANFDYEFATGPFTFDGALFSIQIDGSLLSNGTATFSWPVEIHLNPTSLSVLTSNGTIWDNDFHFIGVDTLNVSDDFSTTKSVFHNSGLVDLLDNDLSCLDFMSNTLSIRKFDMTNSNIIITGNLFDVNSTGLTLTTLASDINLISAVNFVFNGSGHSYFNLHIQSNNLNINGSNSFELFDIISNPTVTFENGSTQSMKDFSSNGTCATPTLLMAPSPGASANIQYTGLTAFTASSLYIDNVDALSPPVNAYNIALSDTTNSADGWSFDGSTYYWIGGTGDWTDAAHWSFSSNGTTGGCVPTKIDFVVFDDNSFSAANQIVTVNQLVEFTTMDWSLSTNNPTLLMTNNIYAYGDITLDPGLTVDTLTGIPRRIEIREMSQLDSDNATINCNVIINTANNSDVVALQSTLHICANRNLFIGKGEFNSGGNLIKSGAIITSIGDTINDLRKLDITNSTVELASGFYSENETTNFTFESTGSHVKIIDTNNSKINYIRTEGLIFNDVTLDFKRTSIPQRITGNNTFNRLYVLQRSSIVIDSASTQTILDSLIMIGTCKDSIYISSSNQAYPANIDKSINTDIIAECIGLQGITASDATITFLYSKSLGSNSNVVFSTVAAAPANFTIDGPYCFGDTTLFTNTSTAVSGNTNDITSQWYFNDGSTGYFYLTSPTDSIYVTYESDTNKHVFIQPGDINVQLVTIYTNFCTDTMVQSLHINNPAFQFSTSQPDTTICIGESVSFENNSSNTNLLFEFFLNGNSLNTPSATDTLYISDTLVNNDIVGAIASENGCVSPDTLYYQFVVNNLPNITWSSNDPDTTICQGQSVSFTATSGVWTDGFRYFKNYIGTTSYIDSVSNWTTSGINNNDTISVVGKTNKGCRDTLSMVFTVNPLPTTTLAASTPSGVICAGDPVTFTASGAATYQFFVAGTSQGPASATATFTTAALSTGQTVSVVGYATTGCSKSASQTFSYTVNSLPVINFTSSDADTSICSGTLVDFNASGASLYEFFINNVSQGAMSSFSTFSTAGLSNNDQVYVKGNFSGCSGNSGIMTFEVLASPVTTLTSDDADQTICNLTPVVFTAGGATSYEFLINGVSQGAPSTTTTFTASALTNNQVVTVNGVSNGCTVPQSITFTVLPVPNVNIFSNDADNTICEGQSITFTGTNAAQYELNINGTSGTPQASSSFTPTLPNGTSTVFIVGTAPNGCSDTSAILSNINVIALPTVNVTSSDADNTICAGTAVTFSGSGSGQYQFFIDGSPVGSMSATSTFTTSGLTNGQTVYAVGSTSGCTNNSNSIITVVNPSPTVTLASTDVDNVYCQNELVTYTASGATNYQFFVNGVSQGASSAVNTINSTGFATGTYNVQVIGESNSCTNIKTRTITVNAVPTASITSSDFDNIICQGETVSFNGSGASLYSFNLNGTAVTSTSPASTYTTNTLVDNDVISVSVYSPSGCTSTSSNITMTVNSTPTVTLSSSDADQTICIGDNVDFTASGASSYEFFVNNVSQGAPSANPSFSSSTLSNGSVVSLNGSNLGCGSNASPITFTVYQYPVVGLTSNGDNQICVGENTDLLASGADNYQFQVNGSPIGVFSPTATFTNPVSNGDIISVIGETNGCPSLSTSDFTFTVFNYPTINSTSSDADNIICLNDTIVFNVSGAMTYSFAINGNEVQNSTGTSYSNHTIVNGDVITIIGFNGDCPSPDDIYNFTVNSMNLSISVANSNLICPGENVTFTASGGTEYEFYLNDNSTGPQSATNTYSNATLNNLDEIDVLAYSSTTGCSQWLEDFVIMNVIAEPTISENSSLEFCEGDSVTLFSNASYGNQWYLDGNAIPGATDTLYTAFTSGLYTLETTAGGNGNVWSIGHNGTGSFGNGNNLNSVDPLQAATTETITEIAGGLEFVLAKTDIGNLLSWGKNSSGQLGLGTYTPHNTPQLVPVVSNVKTVAAAEASSMIVTNTGQVYVWGNNTVGQLGTGNTSVINFPFLNPSLTNVDSIAGGKTHFVILKNDGTVWTVGSNSYGQLGQGSLTPSMAPVQVTSLSNIVSVGAGEYHSFAIDNTGAVYAWGNNGSGQLGLGDLNNRLIPTLVPLKNVTNAQGGANHSAFLTASKKVYTSGGNAYGQLGIGSTTPSTTLKETNLQSVKMISTGQYTTMALRSDKSTFGFGNNSENQLLAAGTIVTIPQQIPALAGVGFIESNNLASHFIFEESHSCVSAAANVNMLSAPSVFITESNDVLTASETGVSYQWFYETNPAVLGTNQTFATSNPGIYYVIVTYANGCTSKSPVYYHHVTGIDEKSEIEFALYPNPVNNELTITWNGYSDELNFHIYDQAGRLIRTEFVSGIYTHKMNTSELQNGVYWLKVATISGEKTYKFVKAN